jgi:rhamnulose-1-phosphate aldolase
VLAGIGQAGRALAGIGACEGAAGNISVCEAEPFDVTRRFPVSERFALPVPVPELAGFTVFATGSGRRLRELADAPVEGVGVLTIDDGSTATLWTSPRRRFERLTSELNSHLAVHADRVRSTGVRFHALVHAQPPRLTMLSHIPEYRDGDTLTRRLLRWEPETIVNLPEGIAVLPYLLPGSPQLMAASVTALRTHRIVLWSKHGVLARSDQSVTQAADIVEYAETAAGYEQMDLAMGRRGDGLSDGELREIIRALGVKSILY